MDVLAIFVIDIDGLRLRTTEFFSLMHLILPPPYLVSFQPCNRKDGARITTRIKKVSGDRDIFLNELRATLQIPIPKNPREDTIRIRTGGTIEIKGNRTLEVKKWLAALGF